MALSRAATAASVLRPHVQEMVECGGEPGTGFAEIVRAEGNRDRFESRPIVGFEHARHQKGGGVGMKIG
jgi:hypothetical protein